MMLKVGESLRVVATDHIIIHRDACGGYVGARRDTGPMHLLVDSTGLKLYGAGEWVEKHGTKRRRSWRKLHLGVDAETGRIVAATLTNRDEDDPSQVGPLLDQVEDPAYDQGGRVMLAEERALASGALWTEPRIGDWRCGQPVDVGLAIQVVPSAVTADDEGLGHGVSAACR